MFLLRFFHASYICKENTRITMETSLHWVICSYSDSLKNCLQLWSSYWDQMWTYKTMVHCYVFKIILLVLLWARWVCSILSHLIIINFNIMHPSVTNYPKWQISSIISDQNFVHIFYFTLSGYLILFHIITLPCRFPTISHT